MEDIKQRIVDFTTFKAEVARNEVVCNKIQTSIQLWKEDLETVLEKNEMFFKWKKAYYWLSYDGLKTFI